MRNDRPSSPSLVDRLIRACLENKLVVVLGAVALVQWGVSIAPFDWELQNLPLDSVPVDAIPGIAKNQQIVFTDRVDQLSTHDHSAAQPWSHHR